MEDEIIKSLMQINAIKLSPQNPFTWASGLKSPIYCDNRITLSYPNIRNLIVQEFVNLSSNFTNIDVIAGVATAGIPHGALLADRLGLPFIYVRDKPKEHGKQNQIEGFASKGSNILVVEDLISTGKSSIAAVKALKNEDYNVLGVLAIFDYNMQIAVDNFDNENTAYKTITNYNNLLIHAKKEQLFDEKMLVLLEKWKQNPENWIN